MIQIRKSETADTRTCDFTDIIELEEHDYQQYVLDEWTWSASATASNTFYTSQR